MKLAVHIETYRGMARGWMKANGYTSRDVTTGRSAWAIAHKCGITNHAYGLSRDVVDAHIQTVLARIFPDAVFQDAKRY